MDQLSINIKIENRTYPMTIKSQDEEDLRLAGKMINDKIKGYRNLFNRADMQDLLSMLAIEIVSENLNLSKSSGKESSQIDDKLSGLDQKLSQYLESA